MDHEIINKIETSPYLFKKEPGKIQMIYAGAMLPKAFAPMEEVFKAIHNNAAEFADVKIHFIGTGKTPDDPQGYNIKPYAEKYGLWQKSIFEYPARIPYLDVLIHLKE